MTRNFKTEAWAIVNPEHEVVCLFDEYLIFASRELAEHYLKTLKEDIGEECRAMPCEVSI